MNDKQRCSRLPKDETSTSKVTEKGNHAVETLHDEQKALSRRRRRSNRIIALTLAVFCVLVFVWIVVRIAGT